jgi:hypothetical protein
MSLNHDNFALHLNGSGGDKNRLFIRVGRLKTGISTMVDWALTHMQGDETLCIDLLYVDDTPEKVAMLELAEACFDLRYARPSVESD